MPQCNLTPSSIGLLHCEFVQQSLTGWREDETCAWFHGSMRVLPLPQQQPQSRLQQLSFDCIQIFHWHKKTALSTSNRDRHLGFLSSHKINNIHFGTLSLPKEHKRSTSSDIGFPLVYINRKFFGTVVPLETHYDRLTKKLQVITSS